MRTSETPGYIEKRSIGRREADRNVCIYHDMCHETVSDIKEMQNGMNKIMSTKLPTWIFKLFLVTTIPITIALCGWMALNAFETVKIMTRLDTNQQHLMEEFSIKPIK